MIEKRSSKGVADGKPAWERKQDPLFGEFRERLVQIRHDVCRSCGGDISAGVARERMRGSSTWHVHYLCPTQEVRSRKR